MFKHVNREHFDLLYQFDTKKILHPESKVLGFDFDPIIEKINTITSSILVLDKDRTHDLMSKTTEERICNIAKSLNKNVIEKSINFAIRENFNFKDVYNEILISANREYDNYIDYIKPILFIKNSNEISSVDINKNIESLKEAKKEFDETNNLVKEVLQKSDDLMLSLRQGAASSASSISANHFSKQSDIHEKMANRWFYASAGLVVFLIFLAIFLLNAWRPFSKLALMPDLPQVQLVQIVVFKVVLLSLAYFALHQSVKNYHVHSHLHIMNRHRHNALSVYPQMLKAGEEPESRNTITAEAARSIFEPVSSGYLGNDDDPRPVNPTAIVNKIIERKV